MGKKLLLNYKSIVLANFIAICFFLLLENYLFTVIIKKKIKLV